MKNKVSREEILASGVVEARVKTTGFVQRHKFEVVRENTAFGPVPFLVCRTSAALPQSELHRLAEEFQLPIKSRGLTVFPKGKMAKDFEGL